MSLPLSHVCQLLERVAPLHLAEPWDNVGLLLEPEPDVEVHRVIVTIDLTEPVLAEALERDVQLIVAYHPTWFRPLRRLTQEDSRERSLITALKSNVALYSPHTALDAAPGGVNDWLAEALGEGRSSVLVPPPQASLESHTGMGRLRVLERPASLDELVERAKLHLGLSQLRVAAASRHVRGEPIQSVAVCAGSGSSVFEKAEQADLWLTGELGHHDVLARVERGESVILCDHTHTERGYLPRLAERLRKDAAGAMEVFVSERDRDPLRIR